MNDPRNKMVFKVGRKPLKNYGINGRRCLIFLLASTAIVYWTFEIVNSNQPEISTNQLLQQHHQQQQQQQQEKNEGGVTTSTLTTRDCRDKVLASRAFEIIMESMMGALFREEGFLAEGNVLDVGAQFGEQACHYAVLAPHRTVYALDPSPRNTQKIKDDFGTLDNLIVITKGIGKSVGEAVVPDDTFEMPKGSKFEVTTMDDLFYHQKQILAFAHIDVEGLELDVLHGGKETIAKWKPVFTVEVRVYENQDYTKSLIDYIYDIGYDAYLVNEVCGDRLDFRNILAFPRHRSKVLEYSDAFNLLMAGNLVIRVDAVSIFDWVYPCCKLGGECCDFDSTAHSGCCKEATVLSWLETSQFKLPPQLSSFKKARRATYKQWYRLDKRVEMSPAEAKAEANWVDNPPFL
jgi:FkbM family methyltransferase